MANIFIQATLGSTKYILEPSADEDILIDISTVENGEIGEVLGDLSRSFSFPATAQNNLFFNQAFEVGFQNIPGTQQAIPVTIETEEQTLFHGTMILDEWSQSTNSYVCSVQSGVSTLTEALKDKKLSDDDAVFSTGVMYNTDTWKTTNEQNATSFTVGDYYFPFVDLGFDKDGRPRIPADDETARQAAANAALQVVYTSGNPEDAQGNRFSQPYYYTSNGQVQPPTSHVTPTTYHGEIGFGQSLQGYITSFTTPLRIEQLTPAIKLKKVVDVIMEQAGFTYTASDGAGGNFFQTMLGDMFIMPKLREGLGIDGVTPQTGHRFIGQANNSSGTDLNPLQTVNTRNEDREVYTFGSTTSLSSEVDPGDAWSNGQYVVSVPGTYEFRFAGELNDVTDRFDTSREFLKLKATIRVNGEIRESVSLIEIKEGYDSSQENTWDFTAAFNLKQGDRVSATVYQDRAKSGHFGSTHSIEGDFDNVQFQTTLIPTIWEGSNVDFGAQFQDELSIDVLKAIVQKLNLVIYQDKNRPKHLIVQQYYDAVLGSRRVDWTDKIDPDTISYTNLLSEQEAQILFSDAEGNDRFTEDIEPVPGSYTFNSTDDGISSGDKQIGQYFAPLRTGSFNRVGDSLRESDTSGVSGIPHIYTVDDTDQESTEGGIYLGYNRVVSTPSPFFYASGVNSVSYNADVRTLSEYSQFGNRTLNWSDEGDYKGAYSTYWEDYIDHLYSSNNRKMSVDVQLDPIEYKELSVFDRIHINGNDYLINNINGFNITRPDVVNVELISYKNNFTNVFQPATIQYVEPEEPFQRTYNLGIQVLGYDGAVSGGVLFPNPVIQQDITNYTLTGSAAITNDEGGTTPATSETFKVNVAHLPGYEVNPSNFSATTTPVGTSVDSITELTDGSLEITITVTVQNGNFDGLLVISGEVDEALPGNTNFTINWSLDSSFPVGSSIQTLGSLRGQEGSVGVANAIINPPAGTSLNATSFTTVTNPLPEGVDSVVFTALGTGVFVTARVTFQDTDTAVALVVDGNDPTVLPTGVQTSEVTFDFTEMIDNVSTIQDLTFIGVQGTRDDFSIPLYAADGYTLSSGNFSATIDKTYVTMFNATGGGETVELPVAIVWPSSNDTVSITLSGSAQLIGTNTSSTKVTFTLPGGSNFGLTELTETFVGTPGTQLPYTNDVIASSDFNVSGITVGAVTNTSGGAANTTAVSLTGSGSGDRGKIQGSIIFQESNQDVQVAISATTTREPHTVRFLINSQELSDAGTSISEVTQGYDVGDSSFSFTIPVSTLTNMQYESGIVPVATIGAFTNSNTGAAITPTGFTVAADPATVSSGDASIVISGNFPTSQGLDITVPINITGEPAYSGDYGLVPSSELVQYSSGGSTTTSTVTFGVVSTPVPGRWLVASQTGATTAQRSGDGSSLTVVASKTGGTTSAGTPFFTSNTAVINLVHQDDSSVTATVTCVHKIDVSTDDSDAIRSQNITNIIVDIGGSAGSTSGTLYIT